MSTRRAPAAKKPRAHTEPPPPAQLPGAEETWRILEDLPVAVVVAALDENPRLLFLNKQFIKTFGYTLDDIPTQEDWVRRAYPDAAYRDNVCTRWNRALESAARMRGRVESMEFRVVNKDGRTMDILFNAIVLGHSIQVTLTDLTPHREAERALRTAQERLQRTAYEVTENIPAGTYTMILKPGEEIARFTFMSSRFLELCGLDRRAAEENPLNAFACVHPDDRDEWVRKNAHCFEKKVPFSEECRVVAHGVTRWILAESVPRDLPDGSIVWEGVLTDITSRKTAEAELAASEARLRKILDNIPIPIAINEAKKDGRITFLNEAFTRTFGYTPEDLPDVGAWSRLAYPDEDYRNANFQIWDAAVAQAVRTGGIVPAIDVHVHAKDGSRLEVLISGAVFDNQLLAGFVDITARRRAEEELRTAREKLQRTAYELTENIPVGTYVLETDAAGNAHFTFTSERWLRMLDLRREDIQSDPSLAFRAVHPDEQEAFLQLNARVLSTQKRFYWEGRIVVRGKTHWVTIESVPREQHDGRVIWEGVMIDITARRQAETELTALREAELEREKQRRENLEAKLRISRAAAAAAHEINQPLGRILLTSELVMKYEAEGARRAPRIASLVRSLAAEARNVVETIEKMKALMRNTGSAQERIDLRDLAESAILYAGPLARSVKAHLHFDRPARAAVIEADADQIQIALNNLLRNAIEAIATLPARHPRDIRIAVRQRKGLIELAVGDSGPGWPDNIPPGPFPESTKPGGTGLGLFIVHTAAKNHGARLEMSRSALGGAEVRLTFPKPAIK